MTKKKAQKHLNLAIESREFWREKYVEACRCKISTYDIPLAMLGGKTMRQVEKEEARQNIAEANERIAKFERIVK